MWVHRQVHRRRKWQPTPVFLPETSHGQRKPGRLQSLGSQRVRHDLAPELACSIMLMKNRRSSLFCSNFLHEIGSQAIIGSRMERSFWKFEERRQRMNFESKRVWQWVEKQGDLDWLLETLKPPPWKFVGMDLMWDTHARVCVCVCACLWAQWVFLSDYLQLHHCRQEAGNRMGWQITWHANSVSDQ